MAYKPLVIVEERQQSSSSSFVPEAYTPLYKQPDAYIEDLKKKPVETEIIEPIVQPEKPSAFKETLKALPKAYKDQTTRLAANLNTGFLKTISSTARGVEWLGLDRAKPVADKLSQWGDEIQNARTDERADPTFIDALQQGAGSAASFFIPSVGVMKGVDVFAKISPRVAALFGGSVMAGLESMAEAGEAYETSLEAGDNEKTANKKGAAVFGVNIIVNSILNRVGIFNSDTKSFVKRTLLSAPSEAIQEATQAVTQNITAGRDPMEGVVESGLIGGILGGVMGGTVDIITNKQDTIEKTPSGANLQVVDEPAETIQFSSPEITESGQQEGAPVQKTTEVVAPELDVLTQEARKYKSAEEFVKGVSKETGDFNYHYAPASAIQKIRMQGLLPNKDGRIFVGPSQEAINSYKLSGDALVRFPARKVTLPQPTESGLSVVDRDIRNGVGTIDGGVSPSEIQFSLDNGKTWKPIMTKSQLTDFYNKVTKKEEYTPLTEKAPVQQQKTVDLIVDTFQKGETITIVGKKGRKMGDLKFVSFDEQGVTAIEPTSGLPMRFKYDAFDFARTAQKESNLPPEIDISPELKERAEEDWTENYAEEYGNIADQVSDLQRQLKEVKSKAEVPVLQGQINTRNARLAEMEDEFVKKWRGEEVEQPVANNKKIATDREAAIDLIRVYVERGDSFQDLKSGGLGVYGDEYKASIGGYMNGKKYSSDKILVAKVGDKEVNAIFSLKELYDEIKQEKKSKKPSVEPQKQKKENPFGEDETFEKNLETRTNAPIREIEGEKIRVPTVKTVYGKGKVIVGQFEGKPYTTNTYILEFEDVGLKQDDPSKGAPSEGAIKDIVENATTNSKELSVEEITKRGSETQIILNGKGLQGEVVVDANYYNYFANKYKNLVLRGTKPQVAVAVYDGKTLKGLLMPINERMKGRDVKTVKVRKEETKKVSTSEKAPSGEASAVYSSKDLPDFPVEMGGMEHIKPVQFPELVRLAKDLMGEYPKIVKKTGRAAGRFIGEGGGHIKLIADLFKEGNIKRASMTLAHEIGHLADYLPEGTLSRGNIIGRLNTLTKFMKSTFGESGVKNSEVRKELLAVTKYWHPYDPESVPESYRKYRESSKELYAEAVSVLFNSPGLLERMAPKFYGEFFSNLDNKPEVKKQFFDLQDLLNLGEDAVLTQREKDIRNMFRKGEDLYKIKSAENDQRKRSYMSRLRDEIIDRNEALISLIEKTKKEGKNINDDENPIYYLEEHNYLGGKIKNFIETKIDPIYKKVQKAGATWEDFGLVLFLNRVKTERGDLANPLGQTPETAQRQLDDLAKKFSPEAMEALNDATVEFRNGIKEIMQEGYKAGLYKPDLYKQMIENPAYATFQVLDYLQEYIPASIKKQVGTLKEISNPATATVIKTISTIRAIERNIVRKKAVEFLQEFHPDEIKPAKKIFDGKKQVPIESQETGEELLTYMDNGMVEGVYVDEYIKKSFEKNTIGQNNAVIQALRLLNSNVFRPLFITYNPGFQAFNLLRDFQRTWKSIPGMSLFNLVKLYKNSYQSAKARAFNLPDATIAEMEKSAILSLTYNDVSKGREEIDDQIDKIMTQYGLLERPRASDNPALKVVMPVLDFIERTGNLIETLPKVAGYKAMNGKLPPKELGSFIRTRIGSPDFLRRGSGYGWYNEVFLFSNAIKEGMRADYATAIKDPKTRSGYWWKTAKRELVPKALMLAAALGVFGDELKELFAGMSEYDKTNYTTIPLGKDDSGKSIYIRIPSDETGRILSALFWKGMNLPNKDGVKFSDVAEIASYTGGQLPSFSPSLTSAFGTAQFMAGNNPYDFFRGRNVLSDTEFEAGGKYALIPFLKWQFQQLGGGTLFRMEIHEQTPTKGGVLEIGLKAPVVNNILGRFLKISNYGITEKNNEIKAEVDQERARERIEENRVINKYIKEFQKAGANDEDVDKYTGLATKQAFKGQVKTVRELKAFQKKFKTAIIRGESDPNVNALIYAETNDAKIALLGEYEKNMSKEEFADIFRFVQEQKIVSKEAAEKFIILKKE